MIEIQAPHAIPKTPVPTIFLGGSIEMGNAAPWQEWVVATLKNEDVVLLNPRRNDWDSTWVQSKDNPDFRAQVEWELDALAQSDYIILYLDPGTQSPISLLEMGLHAQSGKLLVVCPNGFWRKGNVDIVCEKYGFSQFASLEALIAHIRELLGHASVPVTG
jgi:hypothetical protein